MKRRFLFDFLSSHIYSRFNVHKKKSEAYEALSKSTENGQLRTQHEGGGGGDGCRWWKRWHLLTTTRQAQAATATGSAAVTSHGELVKFAKFESSAMPEIS